MGDTDTSTDLVQTTNTTSMVGSTLPTTETMDMMARVSKALGQAGVVPKAYRGKPADIFAAIMLGDSLGLPPMSAMQYVHVVEGKPTMSAEGMVALVRKGGHSLTRTAVLDSDGNVVGMTATGRRADTGDRDTFTFTLDDARTAGLLDRRGPWQQYPKAMLWARAVSGLCRILFADLLMGTSYTPEELGGDVSAEDVQVMEPESAPVPAAFDTDAVVVEPVQETPPAPPTAPEPPAQTEQVAAPAPEPATPEIERQRRKRGATDNPCPECDGYGGPRTDAHTDCAACNGTGMGSTQQPPAATGGDLPSDPAEAAAAMDAAAAALATPNDTAWPTLTDAAADDLLGAMADCGYAANRDDAQGRLVQVIESKQAADHTWQPTDDWAHSQARTMRDAAAATA